MDQTIGNMGNISIGNKVQIILALVWGCMYTSPAHAMTQEDAIIRCEQGLERIKRKKTDFPNAHAETIYHTLLNIAKTKKRGIQASRTPAEYNGYLEECMGGVNLIKYYLDNAEGIQSVPEDVHVKTSSEPNLFDTLPTPGSASPGSVTPVATGSTGDTKENTKGGAEKPGATTASGGKSGANPEAPSGAKSGVKPEIKATPAKPAPAPGPDTKTKSAPSPKMVPAPKRPTPPKKSQKKPLPKKKRKIQPKKGTSKNLPALKAVSKKTPHKKKTK